MNLQEAIDRIREGDDDGLLVKHDDVLLAMGKNKLFVTAITLKLSRCEDVRCYFEEKFNDTAKELLLEASRAKKEVESGC